MTRDSTGLRFRVGAAVGAALVAAVATVIVITAAHRVAPAGPSDAAVGDAAATDAATTEAVEVADAETTSPTLAVTHLRVRDRYRGFRDAVAVGGHTVLVGCDELRILGANGGGRNIAIPRPRDAGETAHCFYLRASDEARLLFDRGDDESLSAFDVGAGRVAWTFSQPYRRVFAAGGKVVVQTSASRIMGLEPETGAVSWDVRLPVGVEQSFVGMTVAGGRVFHDGRGHGDDLHALDAATGAIVWESKLTPEQLPIGKPTLLAADEDHLVVFSGTPPSELGKPEKPARSQVALLDARSGALRSIRSLDVDPSSVREVRLALGGLYLTTDPRRADSSISTVERFDTGTGARRWRAEEVGGPMLGTGSLLLVSGEGSVLRALDPETGATVWSYGFSVLDVTVASDPQPPRLVVDPADPAALAVAVGNSDGVSLFTAGPTVIAPRSAHLDVRLFENDAAVTDDDDRQYVVYGHQLVSDAGGSLHTTVTGRGVAVVMPMVEYQEDGVSARAFDLETGKASYRVDLVKKDREGNAAEVNPEAH